MKTEIIVDDNLEFARQLALLLQAKTGFGAYSTADPEEAVAFARENPLRVAILDQRMPINSGTELFARMRRVNQGFRAIMLTGEASAAEVGKALDLGFNAYVEKGEVNRLPELVREQYLKSFIDEADRATQSDEQAFSFGRRQYLLFGRRLSFVLKSVTVLDEFYVPEDQWKEYMTLTPGEEREYSLSETVRRSVTLEEQSQLAIKSTFSSEAKLGVKFQGNLEEALTRTVKRSEGTEVTVAYAVKQTYRLGADDPRDERSVISRSFESCLTYRRLLARVEIHCPHCSIKSELAILAFDPLAKLATRTRDTLRNGESVCVRTANISAA